MCCIFHCKNCYSPRYHRRSHNAVCDRFPVICCLVWPAAIKQLWHARVNLCYLIYIDNVNVLCMYVCVVFTTCLLHPGCRDPCTPWNAPRILVYLCVTVGACATCPLCAMKIVNKGMSGSAYTVTLSQTDEPTETVQLFGLFTCHLACMMAMLSHIACRGYVIELLISSGFSPVFLNALLTVMLGKKILIRCLVYCRISILLRKA